MARYKTRRCRVCGETKEIGEFTEEPNLRRVCKVCQESLSLERVTCSADEAEADAKDKLEKALRKAYAATGVPGTRQRGPWEKNYWNLATDPWPDLFRGKGLSAEYCPVV